MNQTEAEQLFYDAAARRATEQGYRLGEGAGDQIRDFAVKTAQDLFAGQADENARQEKVVEVEFAFRKLVDTMISVRAEVYRTSPDQLAGDVVGEDTLAMSLKNLCPGFWPFC